MHRLKNVLSFAHVQFFGNITLAETEKRAGEPLFSSVAPALVVAAVASASSSCPPSVSAPAAAAAHRPNVRVEVRPAADLARICVFVFVGGAGAASVVVARRRRSAAVSFPRRLLRAALGLLCEEPAAFLQPSHRRLFDQLSRSFARAERGDRSGTHEPPAAEDGEDAASALPTSDRGRNRRRREDARADVGRLAAGSGPREPRAPEVPRQRLEQLIEDGARGGARVRQVDNKGELSLPRRSPRKRRGEREDVRGLDLGEASGAGVVAPRRSDPLVPLLLLPPSQLGRCGGLLEPKGPLAAAAAEVLPATGASWPPTSAFGDGWASSSMVAERMH